MLRSIACAEVLLSVLAAEVRRKFALPFHSFPSLRVADETLRVRNRALLIDWKVRIRKANLVLSASNDARVCGAHFPHLKRTTSDEVPSVFQWSK